MTVLTVPYSLSDMGVRVEDRETPFGDVPVSRNGLDDLAGGRRLLEASADLAHRDFAAVAGQRLLQRPGQPQ